MSKGKRIKDNPSAAKLLETTKGIEQLSKLAPFLEKFGIADDKISELARQAPDLVRQADELVNTPDRFNAHFSKCGWVAYESLKFDLMKQAVELANGGKLEEAERLLVDYYDVETVRWQLQRMRAVEEFHPRQELAQRALDDYAVERYHSCILTVLTLMDGLVCDIEGKSMFAEGTDLTAWDSIAAHNTGLLALAKLFSRTRRKTTTDEITIPYRNGIIHGRDLGYANRTVAAKTWAALFVVRDWAIAVKGGKKPPQLQKEEQEASLWEAIKSYAEVQEQKRKLDLWCPREIVLGKDCPLTGLPEDFAPRSPERALAQFMAYWAKNNYGHMGLLLKKFAEVPKKKYAGRVREMFQAKELQSFEILDITDKAPVITEIKVRVAYNYEDEPREKCVTVRMIHEDPDGKSALRDAPNGSWRIIESSFGEIAYGI